MRCNRFEMMEIIVIFCFGLAGVLILMSAGADILQKSRNQPEAAQHIPDNMTVKSLQAMDNPTVYPEEVHKAAEARKALKNSIRTDYRVIPYDSY